MCVRNLIVHGLTLVVAVSFAGCASGPDRPLVKQWVEKITLGPEYGGDGAVCSRWSTAPTVSIIGADDEQRRVIRESIDQLSDVLDQTSLGALTLLAPNELEADLLVYVAPLADFPAIAKRHEFEYVEGNWGYFWIFWNGRHEIYDAYVLLASDQLAGNRFRHFALEEISQSLGLSNDSRIFPNSIFYADGRDGGDAVELSELDRKLITFFYTYVSPGSGRAELSTAFDQHW